MKKFVTLMLMLAVAALSLSADVYIKTKTHTDAMAVMGQNTPAKDDVTEQWISDNALALISKDMGYIIDMKKNIMSMVNYASKTYVETTMPVDFTKLLPPEMAAMAGMMTMSATVTPGTEVKKIGNWNCKLYNVSMNMMGMAMPMKVWASTDVPFDTAKFAGLFGALMKGQMRMDDNSVKEFQKIKGFQISTIMDAEIMGAKIHTTSDVQEITVKPAPAGVYAVPAGFTKKDRLSMDELQRR